MAYAAFGEGYAGGQQFVMFTSGGYQWTVADGNNDTGSLIDFTFRRYNPTQGRWLSPDPAGRAAVDPSNPQSWNRYAYALNNPLSNIDPSGLDCVTANDDGSFSEEGGDCPDIDPNNEYYINCDDCLDDVTFVGQTGYDSQGNSVAYFDSNYNYLLTNVTGSWLCGGNCPGYNDAGVTFAANNGFTFQLGVAVNWNFWGPLAGSGFAGLAIDRRGHVAFYWGGGGGMAEGAGVSGGVQLAGSNGNSVCALGGPFTNVSGTAGYELAGTGDYFQGAGDAPGGLVQGGGVTLGVGGGGAASVQVTGTSVHPFGHSCVNGKIQ